jgi:predicted permease
MKNFTVERLGSTKSLLLGSLLIEIIVIPVSIFLVKILAKDKYTRNIFLYGLCFSNFGFMGNAIVSSLFPGVFMEYILFTLVLWVAIYLWGVPFLLGDDEQKPTFLKSLKNFINPMFISMILGMLIGIFDITMPSSITSLVDGLGACMSPIAMLLTGMTLAKSNIREILRPWNIYVVSVIRLIVFPLIFVLVAKFVPMEENLKICALCSLAMPLGLNTIVIPSAYGRDTKIASGMMLVSHLLSIITIPIIFMMI